MLEIFLFVGAFAVCLVAGRRSLIAGLVALITIGYFYGIVRANLQSTFTHLMFDAGVAGVFASQLFRPLTAEQRLRIHDLRLWVAALIGWPVLLFALAGHDQLLIELVGLRANVLLVPFLLLGACLTEDDLYDLARVLAVLNLVAAGFGVAQFMFGIEGFFPHNEVTDIIYRSRDLVGYTAYRIPATFSSAHAYAGTMVMTLPLLVGAWVQARDRRWHYTIGIAIAAALLGVFMAAARSHSVTAGLLVLTVVFAGGLPGLHRFRLIATVAVVLYVVASDARLQRFTTLADTENVAQRVSGSVNVGVLELIGDYPLGNGLASGGTSIPHFLREDAVPMTETPGMESEIARLVLEQGLPGLALWIGFVAWLLTRRAPRKDPWAVTRRMGWVACAAMFASGLIGMGLLVSVPQSTLMLLLAGWVATRGRALPVVRVASAAPSQAAFTR